MAVGALRGSWTGWFWLVYPFILIGIVFVKPRLVRKRNNPDLDVHLGATERHTVHFSFDAYRALARVTVDEAPMAVDGDRVPKWGPTTQWEYKVPVGESEKHAVTFVRTKKSFLGAWRKQTFVSYIDGVVVPPDPQPLLSAIP
jgi:hypothetical protein